jgi:hypothetical protein
MILECLEVARTQCLETIREHDFEIPLARMFVSIVKSCLETFLEKHKEQRLLNLAQEIALLEDIEHLGQENAFSANRHFVEFLQEKDISGKRLKFKELLLNS